MHPSMVPIQGILPEMFESQTLSQNSLLRPSGAFCYVSMRAMGGAAKAGLPLLHSPFCVPSLLLWLMAFLRTPTLIADSFFVFHFLPAHLATW